MLRILFITIFSINITYSQVCYESNSENHLINSSIIKKCNEYSNGSLKKYCDCPTLSSLNVKNKSNIKSHNKIVLNKYLKVLEKSIFTIANDLSSIQNLGVTREVKKKLKNSCNIERQLSSKGDFKEALEKCSTNKNSFSNILEGGISEISKSLKSTFIQEFSEKAKSHKNTTTNNQCTNKNIKTGFVNRCEPHTNATCNMSDNMAEQVFFRKANSDFTELISLAKSLGIKKFSATTSLRDQLTELIFLDEENLDHRISQLENLDKVPNLKEILDNPNRINSLNSVLTGSIDINQLKENLVQEPVDKLEIKCKSIFKNAIEFLCKSDRTQKSPKVTLKEEDFMSTLSNQKDTSDTFAASQYYCKIKVQEQSKTTDNILDQLQTHLSLDEKSFKSAKDMASSVYANMPQKIRGNLENPMLCKEFGEVFDKAKRLGLKQENLTDPDDQFKLYDFQLKEYSRLLSEQCPHGKISDKCSYLAELVKITEDKRDQAIQNQDDKKDEIKTAKENGTKYVARSYLVEQPSLAEAVLIGSSTGATKKEEPKKKKEEVAKSEDKSKSKEKSKKASSQKPTFTSTNSSLSGASEQNAVSSSDNNTNLSIGSSSNSPTGLSLSSSSPSQNYWAKRSKRIDEDIEKAQKYLSTLTDDQKEERKERIEQIKRENATQAARNNLKPGDFSKEQKNIDDHTAVDEGRLPASTKIANSPTQLLRDLENQDPNAQTNRGLNETFNNDLLPDDRIELKKFTPGDSGLINEHNLVDSDGNVLDIMEVKIKGSIEEDFTKVLEEDQEKAMTKDTKMILADPSQDAHFKNLAKALVEKETFLISRYDNEDIKLIIKYNNQSKDYSVEPYADEERLSIYEEDYLEFQKNIANAIKDKTFKNLMKKYSNKLN